MGLEEPTHNPTNPIHNVDNIICISLLRYCRSISHRQWRNLQQHGENHIKRLQNVTMREYTTKK